MKQIKSFGLPQNFGDQFSMVKKGKRYFAFYASLQTKRKVTVYFYMRKFDKIASAYPAIHAHRNNRRYGSGKTSFINHLRRQFSRKWTRLALMDNYYKQRHEQQKDPQESTTMTHSSFIIGWFVSRSQEIKTPTRGQEKGYTFNSWYRGCGYCDYTACS